MVGGGRSGKLRERYNGRREIVGDARSCVVGDCGSEKSCGVGDRRRWKSWEAGETDSMLLMTIFLTRTETNL